MSAKRDRGKGQGGEASTPLVPLKARTGAAVVGLGLGVILVAILAFLFLVRLIEDNKARELDAAYDQLGLVADSRAAAVDDWLAGQKKAIAAMARNPTVQFFLTELAWAGRVEDVTDGRARLQLLQNYLLFSADQTGFGAPPGGPDIPANVDRAARAGLAVLTVDGEPVASTPWTPRISEQLGDLKNLPREGTARGGTGSATGHLIGPFRGESGELSLGVLWPVAPFEGGKGVNGIVGYVLGVRLLDKEFTARLAQPGETFASAVNALIRAEDGQIRHLAGTKDQRDSNHLRNADPDRLAAAFAALDPGAYAIRPDYEGTPVLVTGRTLQEAPWILARTVSEQEVLGAAKARARALMVIFAMAVFSVVIGAALIWRHGASVRVAALAAGLERMTAFLRTVTDSQPTAIVAIDRKGHYCFANRKAGEEAGMDPADMTGKTVVSTLGGSLGRRLEAANREALEKGENIDRILGFAGEAGERIVKSDHIPIDIPEGIAGQRGGPGILMVIEDVTALVSERERREQTLRQLVTTLATIIDGRDPHAARHSRMVAEVAESIAQEMQLDDVMVETAEIAGALMNLGKLMVPRELLTRSGALSAGELQTVRDSILKSAELLKGVAFEGPVVETIREVQAHWDGSGHPDGLAGDDILVTARIVSVANAFVGMISARSYRAALPMDDVVRLLLEKVGTEFDRRPVAALVNLIENAGGRTRWTPSPDV